MGKSTLLKSALSTVATAPLLMAVDGDVGGVGKSTFTTIVAMAFGLVEAPIDVFELDEQGKLARFLGSGVTCLHGARLDTDSDGDRDLVSVFAPLHQALVAMPQTRRSAVLEVGGALTAVWNAFIRETDLQEDVTALGLTMAVFLVLIASEESARQVLSQIRELRETLPSATIVIIRNERDGCPIVEARELPPDLRKALEQALRVYPSIRMPRLRLKSRRIYEKLGLPPTTIISWHRGHYAEACARTGKSLLEAKRFVKDVAAWSETIRSELARILPFLGGGDA
jgi:hypothetical protein